MTPDTEFARDFCAGIGPLQLGVVLVLLPNKWEKQQAQRRTDPGTEITGEFSTKSRI